MITSVDGVLRVGVLVPLSRPGWVEAGRHLLAGFESGVEELNASGGVGGRAVELVVRDSAADPVAAVAAVDELAGLGVVALAGEFHSVVARAVAARAEALGVPFLCSSAVLDGLVEGESVWVARLAPAQSRGWGVFGEFLLGAGHRVVGVVADAGVYWASGVGVLREVLARGGGRVVEVGAGEGMCDGLAGAGVSAVLVLTGFWEPAASVVGAVRADERLAGVLVGTPAGQAELAGWEGVPFLRYMPERLGESGARVEGLLRERLGGAPSFVAFEGFDAVVVLAQALRLGGGVRAGVAEAWSGVAVEGTRGPIGFSRVAGIGVWQWAWAPVQVAELDAGVAGGVRVLRQG